MTTNEMRTKFNVVAIRWRIIIIIFVPLVCSTCVCLPCRILKKGINTLRLIGHWMCTKHIHGEEEGKAGRGGGHLSRWRMNFLMRPIFAKDVRLLKKFGKSRKTNNKDPPDFLLPFSGCAYSFCLPICQFHRVCKRDGEPTTLSH